MNKMAVKMVVTNKLKAKVGYKCKPIHQHVPFFPCSLTEQH